MDDRKIFLVTGATDGIGLETARGLAESGAEVIGGGRREERCREAEERLRRETGNSAIHYLTADFSRLDAVRKLAAEVEERWPRIDGLINNAGIAARAFEVTPDGFESTFQVNFLSPALLSLLLKNLVPAGGRIVFVSSMVHTSGRTRLEELEAAAEEGPASGTPYSRDEYDQWRAYCDSKLLDLIFSRALASRMAERKADVNALHPGVIDTKLLRANFSGGAPPREGARTSLYLALSPEVAGRSGEYWVHERSVEYDARARDEENLERLWRVTRALLGV